MSDDLRRSAISSLCWKLLERGGASAVSLVVQIVMAWLLTPEQFGLLAVMLVFVNIGNVLVQSGLNTALVQTLECDEDDCSTVFWMSFVISIVIYAIVFAAAPSVALFYDSSDLEWPLRVLCLIVVINSYNAVQVAIISRELRFRKIFRATMASVIVSSILGIGSALAGAGLWALVAQQIAYQLVNCLFLAFQIRWRPRFVFRLARARTLFGFGWKLLVSGLLETGYQSLSDLIVGRQFSTAQLGFVSQGKKYPQAVGSMLDGAIQPVMLSAVAHVQNDLSYVKRFVRRALKTSTFLIVPAMAMFALVAEPLVRMLLGEQWLSAVPFLQMYCFVYALLPIHTTNLQALNGMGRSDLFLKLEIVKKACGIAVLLFAAFVLRDVYAIVAGYMITGIVSAFINAWPNRVVLGYGYIEQVRDIAPAFLLAAVSAAMVAPLGMLALPDVATVIVQCASMAVVYLFLAKLFKVEECTYLFTTAREVVLRRKS